MKRSNLKNLFAVIAAILAVLFAFAACTVKENTQDNGDGSDTVGQARKETVYLDAETPAGSYLEYGSLCVNKDADGNPLSLLSGGEEKEYEHGFMAHAYSVIVYDDLETRGFTRFTAFVGANKTARVANSVTSIVFRVLGDGKELWASDEIGAYSDEVAVDVDVSGVNRLALVADSLGGNGNDHAVWADCKLFAAKGIMPELRVFDFEMPSAYSVTTANILSIASATAPDGTDISSSITCKTDYVKGKTGKFNVTYEVSYGKKKTSKTVTMTVRDEARFVINASDEYLTSPFANFLYYGRNVLGEEERKGYDVIMQKLFETDISDSSKTSQTVNLQENGIYLLRSEVNRIKEYLADDEPRFYFIYYWNDWSGGVTTTLKNGFVDTVTIRTYNGEGEYYYKHDKLAVYRQAEKEVSSFLAKLSDDMSEAQALVSLHNAYSPSVKYANVNYADGFYGAFITKNCICSGYSMGYLYLAQRAGARALYTNGTAGGAHAWNYLFADGKWYMSDTTWGGAGSYGLQGKDYMDQNNRYDYGNYAVMPKLSPERYDVALTAYPLMSIDDGKLLTVNDKFDVYSLAKANSNVADIAPITSVTYTGTVNMSVAGSYPITVTTINSLDNRAVKECLISVCDTTEKLSSILPVQSGNSNYAFREVSLYDGDEKAFADGIYTKANGTLTLAFDVSGKECRFFAAYVGIDKVIRDNDPWGVYANASVRILADDTELYKMSGIGWKTDMSYICVAIPDGTKLLKLEITDNSGQGGVGWGDCLLYR